MTHKDAEPLAAASFALSASLLRRLVATGALSHADARAAIESALFQLRRLYGVSPGPATAMSEDSIDIDALLDAAPEGDAERMLVDLLRSLGPPAP
ncbi:MAG TPA: hypothetical protein VGE72_10765 [Azospirillum sp.]